MVGLDGLEPSTSRLSGVRSNQLSYRPVTIVDKLRLTLSLFFNSILNVLMYASGVISEGSA